MFRRLFKNRRGAALVEYALLVGGISLVAAGAVSLFGHKTTDIIGAMVAILPGAHQDDNGPLTSGKLIETTSAASGPIGVDFAAIAATSNVDRLGINIEGQTNGSANGLGGLIVEAH